MAFPPFHPGRSASNLGRLILVVISVASSASAVLYSDGKLHSVTASLNEAITVKSTTTLTLPPGDYTIRSPPGSDAAIRLHMSSVLNATGGDIMGADASGDHPAAAAGVIVGSASRASFYDGVTVRGGSHMGASEEAPAMDPSRRTEEVAALEDTAEDDNSKGTGGDALISQYVGTNVTIHGGTFVAGKGSLKDGHSIHAAYEGQINVHGGSFYGSWMVRDQGSIVVNGCVSRIGTRLVGRLENGHSLDVQLFEEEGGKVTVDRPERCNQYKKRTSSAFGARAAVGGVCFSRIGVLVLFCLGFAVL